MAVPCAEASVINRPCYPDAVAWSDDNRLAVATSSTVVILEPDLNAPRQFAHLGKQEVSS